MVRSDFIPLNMPQQTDRRSIRENIVRAGFRPLAAGCVLLGLSACAQMFTITPEDGSAPAPKAKPKVEKPAKEPEKKPDPKVEKPNVEKPAVKPVEKPKPEVKAEPAPKPVQQAAPLKAQPPKAEPATATTTRPVASVPAPPVARRPEPIMEAPALEPAPAGSDSAGVARLMHAAALWDAVRLFHPAVAANQAEWDNITVRKLTDVRTATTREQYATVMRDWLSRLNDPLTRLVDSAAGAARMVAGGGASDVIAATQIVVTGTKKSRAEDTTAIFQWPVARSSDDSAAWTSLRNAVRNLRTTAPLIIDLRTDGPSSQARLNSETIRRLQLDVAGALASAPAAGAGIRRRMYEGWPDERPGVASPLGVAAWRVSDATVNVIPTAASVKPRRLVIVANNNTVLAPALMALVSTRQAMLVSEGTMSDRAFVPVTRLALGNGLVAEIRTGELINADGNTGIVADTVVGAAGTPGDSAPAIRTAIRIARGTLTPRAMIAAGTSASNAFANSDVITSAEWTTAHYPIMGARLLAAFKMWGTLRAFHAYGELRDENVDEALQRFIPRVEAAADAFAYASTMLEYATTLNDAQAEITSPTLTQHVGAAATPFATRWIEGRAIVTQIASDDAGRATGLAIGDEITAADGFPMPAYMTEHRRFGAASNEWTQFRNSMKFIPRGTPGEALLKVRDASNRERTINVPRSASYLNRFPDNERTTSIFRELPGGVGYVDLDRATEAHIDSAFRMLGESRALILDARGRGRANSSGTMSSAMQNVLRRLATTQPGAAIDRQTIRIISEPCAPAGSRLASTSCAVERRQFEDVISPDSSKRYKGRIVVLIDERTQGAMEQFGLGIESVANPVFIGSSSAGAAGDITSMTLPGHITLTFSGSELRHADGRQLQRVGITPQVEVSPTVKGVRAGADEVLERAQQWLIQQLDPAPTKRKR